MIHLKPTRKLSGRGDRIRTCDLLVPNQALYQAKLHPGHRGHGTPYWTGCQRYLAPILQIPRDSSD